MEIKNIHINDYYADLLKGKDVTIPNCKSWKWIVENNRDRADNVAISEGSRRMTYGEMIDRWMTLARVFSAYNISREDHSRVLVIMPNLAQTASIDYGLDVTGAVCDFIDPTTPLDKIKRYIEQENITDIVGLDLLLMKNFGQELVSLKKEYGIKNIIVCRDMYMNSLMSRSIKLVSFWKNQLDRFSKNVVRLEDAIRNSQCTGIKYDSSDAKDLSLITHTSGTTTGIGKPIPITDFSRNALVKNYELAQFNYRPGMTMMHFIPYFAGYGSVNTAHLGLVEGLELQQVPLFKQSDFGILLNQYKSNIVLATTPCWLNMLHDPRCKDIDLSYLVYASTGGTPTRIEDEEKINDFLLRHGANVQLTKGYGLSELCGCCIVTLDDYNRVGSIGVRHPLMDVLLRDAATGEILPEYGEALGEALVHSDTMTSGVLDGKIIVPSIEIDGKKYIQTKDILHRELDGSYEYVERIDRMFPRYDGYNFYPLPVEGLFNSYSEVDNCVIVPYFDKERNGNVPRVYLQLSPENNIVDREKWIHDVIEEAFVKSEKPGVYKANYRDIPREIVFVDEIPKNTMGKEEYYLLKTQGLDGDAYSIIVEENNMQLVDFRVQPKSHELQKKLKK